MCKNIRLSGSAGARGGGTGRAERYANPGPRGPIQFVNETPPPTAAATLVNLCTRPHHYPVRLNSQVCISSSSVIELQHNIAY